MSKCDPIKIKEVNQKITEFENKIDSEKKRPCTGVNSVNNYKGIMKNDKKSAFTPHNFKVNINPDKKQETKNLNLLISSHQQFKDTLYFLNNNKSDDTGFFKNVCILNIY